MAGFFILILLIALIHYWYVALGAIALYVLWCRVGDAAQASRAREAREARDRLRHERARAEIDQIAQATTQAMFETARGGGEVIDSTAVAVRDGD